MIFKYFRIFIILTSFIFLTGFIPLLSLLGSSYTVATSGSLYKAGAQYFINKGIKSTTGKNSLEFVKEKKKKKNNKKYLNQELKQLVIKRIEQARKKLNLENFNQ